MTGQNCNTPNIFDFLNLSKLCMKFGNLSAYFILYIQFLLFLLTLKSIKTFQVKTWGKICSIQTRHFYYKSLSKVVCSNIHNSTMRKGLQNLHYQNIYESGTNLWIQLAAPTGVTRLHYIWCQTISCNFTPQPQSPMLGPSFAKNVEFSAAADSMYFCVVFF